MHRFLLVIVAAVLLSQLPALARYGLAVRETLTHAAALQMAVDSREARMQRAMDEAK